MGVEKPMGNQPRATEKIRSSKSPIQKVGTEHRIMQIRLIILSASLSLFMPIMQPKAKPITPAKTQAHIISAREFAKRVAIMLITGCLYSRDMPKSPWSSALSHEKYC